MSDPFPTPLNILLADDHALFRDSLIGYINRLVPHAVITALEDLDQVKKELAKNQNYNLVLLDWHMPGVRNVDDLFELSMGYPNLYFALMSGVVRPHQVQKIILSGFRAYLPKTLSGPDMMAAMNKILRGESFVPLDETTLEPEMAYRADRVAVLPVKESSETSGLSARERQAIAFLLEGATNHEIAERMGISLATVKMHLRNSFDKLGVRNRTEAVVRCRELGFIDD